jgi:hypothetical protein
MDQSFNIGTATPEACQARLDSLVATPEWSALLNSRQAGAWKEFEALSHKIAGVPEPVASESPIEMLPRDTFSSSGGPTLALSEQREIIETARNAGFVDAEISEWFSGRTSSPELVAAAKAKWSELESDPEFRQALVKGEFAARRKLRAYSLITSHAA